MSSLRTQLIMEAEEAGRTMASVGQELGLSRERVRQIFKKKTGHGWGAPRRLMAKKLREELEEQIMDIVQTYCLRCSVAITKRTRKEKGYNGSRFCSNECRLVYIARDHRITNVCERCGQEFHPFRNQNSASHRGAGRFCSRKCYLESGIPFGKKVRKDCVICGADLGVVRPAKKFCKECSWKRVKAGLYAREKMRTKRGRKILAELE